MNLPGKLKVKRKIYGDFYGEDFFVLLAFVGIMLLVYKMFVFQSTPVTFIFLGYSIWMGLQLTRPSKRSPGEKVYYDLYYRMARSRVRYDPISIIDAERKMQEGDNK